MVLKIIRATILLVLFCCTLYAKEGYRVVLRHNGSIENQSAYLILSGWNKNVVVDSSVANKRGDFIFSGKQNLKPGEYLIKYNGKSIEFFISEKGYTNSKFILDSNLVRVKRGSAENFHFLQFQNLISHGWKTLPSAAALQNKLDSTAAVIEKECSGSLFDLMLNGESEFRYLKDNRIACTRYGKKYLKEYLKKLEYNHNDSIINKIDTLIEIAGDSIKPLVAAECFKYFCEPQIMGQESIACHIAEKFFLSKTLKVSQEELFEMNTFVLLNGKSLVGMQAQELQMKDSSGNTVSLQELALRGEYTIIYFYTDDCISCKIETPKLVDFTNSYQSGILNVYAVYTQDSESRWKKYISDNFYIYNPFVNWINVWDPQIESGFHLLYNVISTPQIYLLDKTGTIVGRGLDVAALTRLVELLDHEQANLRLFLETYFSQYKNFGTESVNHGIDLLYEKSKDDVKISREIFAELYRFLKQSENNEFKESAIYAAKKYIAGMEETWERPKFIESIKQELRLLEKNSPGSVAADIIGEDTKGNSVNLHGIKGSYKVLYFYSTGCSLCTPVTEELLKLYKNCSGNQNSDIGFVAINTGSNKYEWLQSVDGDMPGWHNIHVGNNQSLLHQKYYLELLPVIYLLDSDNKVIKRNLTILDLKKILES